MVYAVLDIRHGVRLEQVFAGHQSTAEHGSWPGSGSLRLYGEYKISLGITMRNLDIKLE